MSARQEASRLVWVDNLLFCGLAKGFLQRLNGRFYVLELPFFGNGLPLTVEGLYVGLQASVARGATMIFAQIFNGGVFVWHSK